MEGVLQARGHGEELRAQNEQDGGDDHAEEVQEEEDPRMRLTEQEREWALAIKEAVVGDPELDNLTDFFYAQLALVDKENVQAAVERAQRIQYFRQEYGIVDTTQMAMKFLRDILEFILPGVYLSFSWNPDNARYVMVLDLSKMDGGVLRQKPEAKTKLKVALYYMGHMMSPDLEAIRRGVFMLAECEGFSFRKNYGIDFFRQATTKIGAVYPRNFEGIKYFHTGLVFNLLISMSKQFLPPEVHSKLQVGCISNLGRLDGLYLVPSLEAANNRFLVMARACLDKYYANSASFSFD